MEWWLPLLAVICNLPLGYIVVRKQALTLPGGLLTAGTMGLLLFLAHPVFWLLLVAFFGSSTLLTRYRATDPTKQEALSLAEKGGQRDAMQVLANGGLPTVFAVINLLDPVDDLLAWYSLAVAMSLAVVNADTWATEVGVTSAQPPRWILNPARKVPRGSSGGISPRGLLGSLLASLLIAAIYSLGLLLTGQFSLLPLLLIVLAGMLGSLLDSLLGATVQAQYYCASCDKLTEQRFHQRCSTVTTHDRGLTWFNNDLVNFLSTVLSLVIVLPLLG